MYDGPVQKPTPKPEEFAWDEHPEAVLGAIYLYFASSCNPLLIQEALLEAFLARHQDEKQRLTIRQIELAVAAVRALDGRSGPRAGKVMMAMWDALAPLREHFSARP